MCIQTEGTPPHRRDWPLKSLSENRETKDKRKAEMSERGGKRGSWWCSECRMDHWWYYEPYEKNKSSSSLFMGINMLYFDELFFDADIIPSPAKHPIDLHRRRFPGRNASFNGPFKCSCNLFIMANSRHYVSQTSRWGSLKLNNADICVTAL